MRATHVFLGIILIIFNVFFYMFVGNVSDSISSELQKIFISQKATESMQVSQIEEILAEIQGFYSITYSINSIDMNKQQLSLTKYDNMQKLCQIERCKMLRDSVENGVIIGETLYEKLTMHEQKEQIVFLADGSEHPIIAIVGEKTKKSLFDNILLQNIKNVAGDMKIIGDYKLLLPKSEKEKIVDKLYQQSDGLRINDQGNKIDEQSHQKALEDFIASYWTFSIILLCIYLCLLLNYWQQSRKLIAIKYLVGAKKRRLIFEFAQKMSVIALVSWVIGILLQQMTIYLKVSMFYQIHGTYYFIMLLFNCLMLAIVAVYIFSKSNFIDMSKILK